MGEPVKLELRPPKPCPFCANASVRTASFDDKRYWQVVCTKCGCLGPAKSTDKEAIIHWNFRACDMEMTSALLLCLRTMMENPDSNLASSIACIRAKEVLGIV